jgi:hypothetical protein
MKEAEGFITAVRKDKKGLKLGENWFSNQFLKEDIQFTTGDKVKVTTNDKGFLQKVDLIEKATKETFTPFKEQSEDKRATELMNCITALTIKTMEYNGASVPRVITEIDKVMPFIADVVSKSYKLVKINITEKPKVKEKDENAEED